MLECFEIGCTPTYVASLASMPSRRIVNIYFQEWRKKISEQQFVGIMERQIQVIGNYMLVMSNIIYSTKAIQNKIIRAIEAWDQNQEGEIRKNPEHVYNPHFKAITELNKINKFYAELITEQSAVEVAPLIVETTRENIMQSHNEELEKYKKEELKKEISRLRRNHDVFSFNIDPNNSTTLN